MSLLIDALRRAEEAKQKAEAAKAAKAAGGRRP